MDFAIGLGLCGRVERSGCTFDCSHPGQGGLEHFFGSEGLFADQPGEAVGREVTEVHEGEAPGEGFLDMAVRSTNQRINESAVANPLCKLLF